MVSLGFEVQQETVLAALVQDVQKSSEIEGEHLDGAQIRSSIARRLGMDVAGLPSPARDIEGVVAMTLNATQDYEEVLTKERLYGWHADLFPTGRSAGAKISVGAWRDDASGPMQVVSGGIGHERVHFEAPGAERVDAEMSLFLDWFERKPADPVVKAAVSHLWFVTIHPFDDGNGRIGRAVMDMALARFDRTKQRFYSMSGQIYRRRSSYYDVLERSQKASMDVTQWIQWFVECLDQSFEAAETILSLVNAKNLFWKKFAKVEINERQRKVLNRLLDGFEGKLQTGKYAKLARCSADTALRDLSDLVAKGMLRRDSASGGRSTSYVIVE